MNYFYNINNVIKIISYYSASLDGVNPVTGDYVPGSANYLLPDGSNNAVVFDALAEITNNAVCQ